MNKPIDLSKLAEPFPAEDVEWRVSRAGISSGSIYCMVLAYITARAIQKRLDDVCGPENWRLEVPLMLDLNGKPAFACGLSIRTVDTNGDWITKWDVAEPTREHGGLEGTSAKGGWSGAMKRAGAQWGIGRYLYHLDETFAEVAETKPGGSRNWNYATLPERHGGSVYYWKAPNLPGFALPKEPEHEINQVELDELKKAWRLKFAQNTKSPADLREGFTRFIASIAGEFPISDYTCWTRDNMERCAKRIEETTDPNGPSADVPFDSE